LEFLLPIFKNALCKLFGPAKVVDGIGQQKKEDNSRRDQGKPERLDYSVGLKISDQDCYEEDG
jgi:hypothetical protein